MADAEAVGVVGALAQVVAAAATDSAGGALGAGAEAGVKVVGTEAVGAGQAALFAGKRKRAIKRSSYIYHTRKTDEKSVQVSRQHKPNTNNKDAHTNNKQREVHN